MRTIFVALLLWTGCVSAAWDDPGRPEERAFMVQALKSEKNQDKENTLQECADVEDTAYAIAATENPKMDVRRFRETWIKKQPACISAGFVP